MNVMNIFVSIPMRGRSDSDVQQDIEKIRGHVLEALANATTDFLNYWVENDSVEEIAVKITDNLYCSVDESLAYDESHVPVLYLGEAIKKMAQCNVLLLANGWAHARGCICEHTIAAMYNLVDKYIEAFDDRLIFKKITADKVYYNCYWLNEHKFDGMYAGEGMWDYVN